MSKVRGREVPVPIKIASKPSANKSSTVKSTPASTWVLIFTPSPSSSLISRRTTSFGRRKSGIPKSNTPPGSLWASKIVTSKSIFAKSPATVKPAGPLPITATLPRIPLEGGMGFSSFSWAKSAMNISKLPISIPHCFLLRMQ